MSAAASVAARVAGAVTALGYLLGVVDGPIVAVVGALALITFGRSLVTPAGAELIGPLAFAVVAGATGVVALRWSSLDLAAIRGVQAVLGPSVAVGPTEVAAATGVALASGVLAAGLWLADDLPGGALGPRWRWVETTIAGLVLATLFAGPQVAGVFEVGTWLAATAGASVLIAAVGRVLGPRSARVRVTLIAGSGVLVAAAAGIAGGIA